MFQFEYSTKSSARIRTASLLAWPNTSAQDREITAIMPMVWEEHCTECAYPTCYTTCALYRPRADGHCARFDDGIAAVDVPHGGRIPHAAADMTFGRWAKLEAALPSKPVQVSCERADLVGMVDRLSARGVRALAPSKTKERIATRYGFTRQQAVSRIGRTSTSQPDALEIDVWSGHSAPFQLLIETGAALHVTAEAHDSPATDSVDLTRWSVTVQPGFNHLRVRASDLGITAKRWPDRIYLYPENDLPVHLVFRTLELVWLTHSAAPSTPPRSENDPASPKPFVKITKPAPKVKVVVWDLDNTLWHGTLVEDGPEKLVLRDGARELIGSLDARGILLSIASKNDAAPALDVVTTFGLRDYFLEPQISWGPKSLAIRRIADQLNLGVDSFFFLDDSAFERGEVRESLGELRIEDPASFADIRALLERPEFDVPVTEESKQRRSLYRVEAERQQQLDANDGDYDAFLRSCGMTLRVFRPSSDAEVTRCVELIHRTNQLNLTTRRLTEEEFGGLRADPNMIVVGLDAADRFGGYGIIGVAVVDQTKPGEAMLTDFVTSCRVAKKAVEVAFFEWLRNELLSGSANSGSANVLLANFLPTERNHILKDVLDEVGFVPSVRADVSAGAVALELPLSQPVKRSDIVRVIANTPN